MTDAAYCLRETEKERKSLARMSRYKKNGSRTNYVQLRQDNMTHKEWKKMNSAVETFKLDRVMNKYEFRSLTDEFKREYILHLIRKYNARQIDIAGMLGLSQNHFWSLCKELFGNKSPFAKGRKMSAAWLNFINPPANDEVAVPDDEVAPPPDVKLDVKPEPVAPAIDGNDYLLESYRVRYSGKPMLIFAEAMKALDPGKDYVIQIEAFNAHETPCTLPF